MAMEPCPICGVSVKAENLLRHVEDNHPKHPDASGLRQRLREDTRYAPVRPRDEFRWRRWHVALAIAVVLIVAGAIFLAPYFDPYRNFNRDSCVGHENAPFHIHPWLQVVIDGTVQSIPGTVGHTPGCLKPLHTHDGPSEVDATLARQIHVEGPIVRDFTLGDFFFIWDEPLTPTQVMSCAAGGTRVVAMTVNGVPNSEFGALTLADGQQIRITCGNAS